MWFPMLRHWLGTCHLLSWLFPYWYAPDESPKFWPWHDEPQAVAPLVPGTETNKPDTDRPGAEIFRVDEVSLTDEAQVQSDSPGWKRHKWNKFFDEAAPAGTEAPGECLYPYMLGDYLTYTGSQIVTLTFPLTDFTGFPIGTITDNVQVRLPNLTRGAFKIAENESPLPRTRAYVNYNYFRVRARPGASTSTLTVDPGVARQLELEGPVPVRRTLRDTLFGNVTSPLRSPLTTLDDEVDVHRQIVGFEWAFLGGNASVGLRVPFVQAGNLSGQVNGSELGEFMGPEFLLIGGSPAVIDGFAGSNLQDLTAFFKVVLMNSPRTGNVLSAGLAVTAPTGRNFLLIDGQDVHPTLLQPFLGYFINMGRFFVHGFSSVSVPTDDRDVMLLFNDIGIGCRLYQSPVNQLVTDLIPTVELHVNTPLTHRGSHTFPVGTPDQIDMTAGFIFGIFRRSTLSIGVAVPVTGPLPFDFEAITQWNVNF